MRIAEFRVLKQTTQPHCLPEPCGPPFSFLGECLSFEEMVKESWALGLEEAESRKENASQGWMEVMLKLQP